MANVLGHVVHDGAIVGYFEYHGSSSRAETVIYPTEAFYLRSGQVNECTCGKPPVDVLLWTEYGGGYYWPSQACLDCKAIVGERYSFERDDDSDGHPLGAEFETEWAKLCRCESC
jgi:hypothetical protein